MKLSNKEKIMLCILGIIIVTLGYYNLIYKQQVNKIALKAQKNIEIKEKYEKAMNTINSLESKKSDIKILKSEISNTSEAFYPIISEEQIILELDKLLNDNNLDGTITFDEVKNGEVESEEIENTNLPESSLQKTVDEYADWKENKDNKSDSESKNSSDSTLNSSNSDVTKNSNNAEQTNDKEKSNKVHYLKCSIKFEGAYTDLNEFLKTIRQNERKIIVNGISISKDTLDTLSGKIDLEIYAIPKLNDEIDNYLKWNFDNTYGKEIPFSTAAATGAVVNNDNVNDFVVSVKSSSSDLPSIMIGKAKDSMRNTYEYADSNSNENVEIVLTKENNKYYYKYKTSKGSYPSNYNILGNEFTPESKNIVISVLSESRISSDDKSGVKLKVINNTDKLVNVDISGEDKDSPRVVVEGDSSNISVNQK